MRMLELDHWSRRRERRERVSDQVLGRRVYIRLLRSALSPIVGERWRGGSHECRRLRLTPLLNPPPQGGREPGCDLGESLIICTLTSPRSPPNSSLPTASS